MTKVRLLETVTVIAIAAVVLAGFVPAAEAQGKDFKFEIPFEFYVGGVLLPAGHYSVMRDLTGRATQIYDRNGHVATVLPIVSASRFTTNNRMVFNRYGGMTFLSEIQWANSETGYKVRESKLERDTRLGTPPVRVAVQPKQ
jgi:hypothetical protein